MVAGPRVNLSSRRARRSHSSMLRGGIVNDWFRTPVKLAANQENPAGVELGSAAPTQLSEVIRFIAVAICLPFPVTIGRQRLADRRAALQGGGTEIAAIIPGRPYR